MHQNIYRQSKDGIPKHDDRSEKVSGYYDGNELVRVDGVWPPHDFHEVNKLETLDLNKIVN